MTILKKSIDQNYTQGTPGVPATPGSSARKAYTSYEPGWGWSYTQVAVAEPPGWWQVNYSSGSFVDYIFDALTYDDLGNAATGTWYRVQATWEPIIVPVYHPATAAVAPTPGIPATAASFVTDYRIGWNAGARSVKAIGGDGRLAFKAPASSRGVVAGLNEADTGTSIAEIDHAFYISAGKYKVVEQGIDRTAFALFADGGEFSIQRRGGSVSYYFGETLVYSSAAASASDLMADCSLYYGGDSVIDASISADLYGASFAHAGLQPIAAYAYAGAGQVADAPALSGAGVSLCPMLALGSDKAYAASSAPLLFLRTAGHGSVSRFEANVALSALVAQASGHEATKANTLLPALTALGSNKKYAAAGAALQPLGALGESSGLNPTYAISRGCLAFAQADAHGLTGGVGQGAASSMPLQSLAADHAYGDARTSFAAIGANAGIHVARDGVFAGRFGKYALKASATEREPNKLAATLAYTFTATAGASAQLALPKYSAVATGEGVVVGRALLAAPAFSLAASGDHGSGLADHGCRLAVGAGGIRPRVANQ
jgi:hypothetical protein